MNRVINEKSILRERCIELRKNIDNKDIKSIKIFNKIISLEEYKNANIIALYKNLDSEVSTEELIKYSIDNGKIVSLPKVIGEELKFYKINSINSELIKSKFGVYEPIDDANNYINPQDIDLIIVPGVAFDKFKNRLGFGKGFYDRFLEKTKAKSIAVAFEEQVVKGKIPTEENDIKIDEIITDKSTIV